jgi:hypothetical protein
VVGIAQLAVELGDRLGALEVNPVLVSPTGAVAVDVLVEPRLTEPDESGGGRPCTA